MNAKIYNGNVQPNHKEYKIWVNDEGIIKTWNGTEWVELSGISDDNDGSGEGSSSGGSSVSIPKWTGHADVEGLKAIGWTDEDIAYYQEHGVNWNEEDDEYHKVPEDNIALYGVLTADNISNYKDRIVYLPKIDTSGLTSMKSFFQNYTTLVSIPMLSTSSVTTMEGMFGYCYSLVCVPLLDTSNVTTMLNMFMSCCLLKHIPEFNTNNLTTFENAFNNCRSLRNIPSFNTPNLTSVTRFITNCCINVLKKIDTSKCTTFATAFSHCNALTTIQELDMSSAQNASNMFLKCGSLTNVYIKNCCVSLTLNETSFLTKDSIIYIINNEAATSTITIKLSSHCYDKYAEDADVVAALSNHPNILLSK